MYECIPPLTVDAFLDPEKIDKCITGRPTLDPMGYEKKTPRIIAMDPGVVHDRYALVMCHWDSFGKELLKTTFTSGKVPERIRLRSLRLKGTSFNSTVVIGLS